MSSDINNLLRDKIPEIQLDLNTVKIDTTVPFDLYDEYGNVVVEINTPLTEPLIKHLKSTGIKYLYYNPAQSKAKENPAGLDTGKNVLDESQQKESIDLAKEVLDSIKSTIDFTPKSITPDKIKKTYKHVDDILNHIENNSDSIFIPFNKLKSMSEYTYIHSSNVSILGALLGARLEYNRTVRVRMGVGGLFHDIGKVLVDDKILNKESQLTEDEFRLIRNHPQLGYNLVKDSRELSTLEKSIVLFHHERPDGQGYPFKYDYNSYTGNVPKEVRLLSICDAYSSLTIKTPYREAFSPKKALRIILNSVYAPFKKKSQFLPADVRDFIRSLGFMLNKGEYFFEKGETVRLSSGEIAVIEEMNRLYPINPKIRMITNKQLKALDRPVTIDLLREPSIFIAHIFDRSTMVQAGSKS
ncbi:MAG: HD domain-containing protein [Spirochaetes bacterium]|nr:HD domain-containing protein [Spirochaetota bacterium]